MRVPEHSETSWGKVSPAKRALAASTSPQLWRVRSAGERALCSRRQLWESSTPAIWHLKSRSDVLQALRLLQLRLRLALQAQPWAAVDADAEVLQMSGYRKLAVTLILYCVVATTLTLISASFVWRLPDQMIGSPTFWIYLTSTAALGLIAFFFGAFAYGLSYRLIPNYERDREPFRVLKRIGGLVEPGGQRQAFVLVVARGGLWILPASGSSAQAK